jgi:hypothetical protein
MLGGEERAPMRVLHPPEFLGLLRSRLELHGRLVKRLSFEMVRGTGAQTGNATTAPPTATRQSPERKNDASDTHPRVIVCARTGACSRAFKVVGSPAAVTTTNGRLTDVGYGLMNE